MAKKLTDRGIAALKPTPGKRVQVFDAQQPGLCVRVTASGTKTFTMVARNAEGKQLWREIGRVGVISLEDARATAREGWRRLKEGQAEPFPAVEVERKPDSFETVAESFFERVVTGKRRTAYETRRILDVYVLPRWRMMPISEIRRRDVNALLDQIEDGTFVGKNGKAMGGPVMADRTLAVIRKLFNWYATRDDDFVSPVIAGMGRTRPAELARDRFLTDDEIRAIWPQLTGNFGALVKMLLLTAGRRSKVAAMKWCDIDADGIWTLLVEAREKANAGVLPLSSMARDVIAAQPRVDGCEYIFPGRIKKPIAGFATLKRDLDARVAASLGNGDGIPHWTLHDLRRTAKTLMQRAGVRPDISERVLGHTIAGVEGVYDRHDYLKDKGDALERLAEQVQLILQPKVGNVTSNISTGE